MTAKSKNFDKIQRQIDLLLLEKKSRNEKLANICKMFNEGLAHYDWVGFYLVNPDNPRELVLGPYVGEPTEHVRIPFGRGICGQAAETKEIFVIGDVGQESNYLSCNPLVKSEIVLPIFRNGQIAGELDVDSHRASNFDDEDREFLTEVCVRISSII